MAMFSVRDSHTTVTVSLYRDKIPVSDVIPMMHCINVAAFSVLIISTFARVILLRKQQVSSRYGMITSYKMHASVPNRCHVSSGLQGSLSVFPQVPGSQRSNSQRMVPRSFLDSISRKTPLNQVCGTH